MLRPALVLLALGGSAATIIGPRGRSLAPAAVARDTVQPGSPALSPRLLQPYTIDRVLTLTRGDTTRPFGRQHELFTAGTLDGRPVLLHVVTFDTPNALTVDSSWVDPQTLSPIRVQSSNRNRAVTMEFASRKVRVTTTPAGGTPTTEDHPVDVAPFEWNMLPLALSTLPLQVGYRASLPVFFYPEGRLVWYAVQVTADTFLTRASGYRSPMWELTAISDSGAPNAKWWVSQHHRFVDQSLVSEPGISILYARSGL